MNKSKYMFIFNYKCLMYMFMDKAKKIELLGFFKENFGAYLRGTYSNIG